MGPFLTFIWGGGGGTTGTPQKPVAQTGGAAAGITVGWGAGIPPIGVPAHTMLAAATTTRMNPRIPSFLTIPSSSFRQTIISENLLLFFLTTAAYFFTFIGIGGGGAIGTGQGGGQTGLHFM